jgi:hypoxanthine phosphoribosyltransferase
MKGLNYRIFLSANFDKQWKYIRQIVIKIAEKKGIKLIIADPGTAARNLPIEVLNLLKSVEGLLVIIHEESNWIRNEIGMAFALDLPMYLICTEHIDMDDISTFLTSYLAIDISNPTQLENSIEKAFSCLIEAIKNRRKNYFEPIPIDKPIEIYSWDSILEMIKQAHGKIHMDPGLQGGYRPTLILGLSRGGIIVADILSRLGDGIPLGILEADRKTLHGEVTFKTEYIKSLLQTHLSHLKGKEVRVLVVDDVMKTGTSMNSAVKRIKEVYNSLEESKDTRFLCEALVLIKQKIGKKSRGVKYIFEEVTGDTTIVLPWGLG